MARDTWKPGDRVWVDPAGRTDLVRGTVVAVDQPGLPLGVRVKLDRKVRGVDDCYAAHGELKAIAGADQEGRE